MKEWGDATSVASPHCLFLYLVVLLTCSVKGGWLTRGLRAKEAWHLGIPAWLQGFSVRASLPWTHPNPWTRPADSSRRPTPWSRAVDPTRGPTPCAHPADPPHPADKVCLNERLVSVYGRNRSSNDALCPGTCTQGTIFSLCRCLGALRPGVLASSMTKAPPKCMAGSSFAHSSFIDSTGSIVTSRTKQS